MRPPLDIIPLGEWLPLNSPALIVAGPCSAESEEQVLETAHELAKNTAGYRFSFRHMETKDTPQRVRRSGNYRAGVVAEK